LGCCVNVIAAAFVWVCCRPEAVGQLANLSNSSLPMNESVTQRESETGLLVSQCCVNVMLHYIGNDGAMTSSQC